MAIVSEGCQLQTMEYNSMVCAICHTSALMKHETACIFQHHAQIEVLTAPANACKREWFSPSGVALELSEGCQPDSLVSVPASDSGCTASRTDKKTFVKRVMKHYYRKFYQISESGLAKYFSEFSSMLYRRTFHAVSWYLIPECQEVAITSYRNCQGCF